MSETIYVRVVATRGSVPRECDAWMGITQTGQIGTIGGGALEYEATRIARDMLDRGLREDERVFPLGPGLGQCCGGAVTLRFTNTPPEGPEATPLWIWGAGHVGRALVGVLAPLPEFAVTWVDDAPDRFPADPPGGVGILPAPDMAVAMQMAPVAAHHLILSYSHEIDLALCHAALRRGFASCGLIGSATKWARFRKRLRALGHDSAEITRITCPIGDPGLGKHPQAIAVGVAAGYLRNTRLRAAKGDDNDRRAADA